MNFAKENGISPQVRPLTLRKLVNCLVQCKETTAEKSRAFYVRVSVKRARKKILLKIFSRLCYWVFLHMSWPGLTRTRPWRDIVVKYSRAKKNVCAMILAHSVWAKVTNYHHNLFYLRLFNNCNPLGTCTSHQSGDKSTEGKKLSELRVTGRRNRRRKRVRKQDEIYWVFF